MVQFYISVKSYRK